MKQYAALIAAGVLVVLPAGVLAQTQQGHEEHHPGATAPQSPSGTTAPSTTPSMESSSNNLSQMPQGQMMQNMPQSCAPMMQQMMQQMMQGRMGANAEMQAPISTQSQATKAYLDAAARMHGPMMEGLQASDADIAFVRGMVAHHQGAMDIAKVVLQYGKDGQTKKWADDVIREQQREITEMHDWLRQNSR